MYNVESLLSVRFLTKLLWKEDLAVCLIIFVAFHASLYMIIDIYSWAFLWFHRFVHTSLDSFTNLRVNWPINSSLIGYLTSGKYEVALIKGILRIILLAVGWVVDVDVFCLFVLVDALHPRSTDVDVLHRHKTVNMYIVKMNGNASDWLFYAGGALIKEADSAGLSVHAPDRATTLGPLTWMK